MGRRLAPDHARQVMAAGTLRHPIRSAEREAEHLREIADAWESAATPLILIGTWIVVAASLVALTVTLATVAAYLIAR
jgi:hypothetical protein